MKFFAVKYFMKYFINFTLFFFRLYTHQFNIFIRQTLPFIHLCTLQLSKPICRPTCLVCLFKSFHNILPDEGLCRLYYV